MTVQEILREIPQLSTRDQLMVLQAVSTALSISVLESNTPASAERVSVADRLYGAFNPTGQEFTDEAIDHIRFEALMEKHLGAQKPCAA